MDIREKIKPGNKLKLCYSENNTRNKTIHIRGVVDDQIIFRHWLTHKKRWNYRVEPFMYFHLRELELSYLGKSKK